MRQFGTVVLIIGIIGVLFFGIRTLIHADAQDFLGINPGAFATGFTPLIISILVVIVGILMFLSAGKKVRK